MYSCVFFNYCMCTCMYFVVIVNKIIFPNSRLGTFSLACISVHMFAQCIIEKFIVSRLISVFLSLCSPPRFIVNPTSL